VPIGLHATDQTCKSAVRAGRLPSPWGCSPQPWWVAQPSSPSSPSGAGQRCPCSSPPTAVHRQRLPLSCFLPLGAAVCAKIWQGTSTCKPGLHIWLLAERLGHSFGLCVSSPLCPTGATSGCGGSLLAGRAAAQPLASCHAHTQPGARSQRPSPTGTALKTWRAASSLRSACTGAQPARELSCGEPAPRHLYLTQQSAG